jgi:hypothetical protein
MNAKIRRRIEMGDRALIFSRAHPNESTGYGVSLARLEAQLKRADQLFIQQREGKLQVHAAALRKVELRRLMQLAHLVHFAAAADAASIEVPELRQKFKLPRTSRSFMAFRTAARAVEAAALQWQETLERHGMAAPVLESFSQTLEEFESASQRVDSGRLAHIEARAELEKIGREVVHLVRLMDGFNRVRFARDGEALAAWDSAQKVMKAAEVAEGAEQAERMEGMEGMSNKTAA